MKSTELLMNYDPFAHTFSESRKNHSWPEIDAIIEDMRSSQVSSVLDVGCGNGRFLEEAEKHDFALTRYLGTDNSEGMIREAKKLHPDFAFITEDMRTLQYRDGIDNFDAILFLASFHHLETREDRISTLSEAKALLTPKGKIYMTNWNLRDQPRYTSSETSPGEYAIKIGQYSRYYHGFTIGELEELAECVGLKILRHEIFSGGRNIFTILSH